MLFILHQCPICMMYAAYAAYAFRCLTCDRELRTATQKGGAFARGGLLPKLDGMTLPHSSVPGGPGLHAAEKRQLSTTSPPPYRCDAAKNNMLG